MSVLHPIIVPGLRWLAAMATGAFLVWASVAFLADQVAPAIREAAELKTGDGRGLDYVANLEPIPAGSITMIAPLPKVVIKAPAPAVPATVETTVAEAAPGERWRVTDGVNVRREASSRSAVIGTLAEGRTVRVIDSRRGWQLVEYENGIRGWVYGRYLRRDATVAAAD